ncbi:ribosomal protein S18 acetylase RimI-like enzyme [Salirhabdus euzebyi]|uniref:Ribosomal protein S18 acetylase RimI-like enzyme n=1 Tax=Salirhabdus euzebyi TaxID=394506 RepID=A0A841Q559_9BACI|nr:GNAT family N-acetyltransferase [Salirhabdus euzebyi]MBB6453541.1 ribosomal protein S18 acetylase RimI-like enzyme [Salirhabdus euzebyi]
MKDKIRTLTPEDKEAVWKLYHSTKSTNGNVVFWFPNYELSTDPSSYGFFRNGELIGKGQVQLINKADEENNYHAIYINIKVSPNWDEDVEIKNALYKKVYEKALHIKEGLSAKYKTRLCVGNFSTERWNNVFFEKRNFIYFSSQFLMKRDIRDELFIPTTDSNIDIRYWKMEGQVEEQLYLKADKEIWPHASLLPERLKEYKSYPLWTAITAFKNNDIVGSVMAWKEQEGEGVLEDLFVREANRGKGIAKSLIMKGLNYLKNNGLTTACLEVLTENETALSLYKACGFEVDNEEVRYYIEI